MLEIKGDLNIFTSSDFGQVRTAYYKGEPWFLFLDLTRAVRLKNPSMYLSRYIDSKYVLRDIVPVFKNDGKPYSGSWTNLDGLRAFMRVIRFKKKDALWIWIDSEILTFYNEYSAKRQNTPDVSDEESSVTVDSLESSAVVKKLVPSDVDGYMPSEVSVSSAEQDSSFILPESEFPSGKLVSAPVPAMRIFDSSEFGNIRTMIKDDKILFCALDICNALGYLNPTRAVEAHCKKDGVFKTVIPGESGHLVSFVFISEPNLYRLIINSHLPAAEHFERWVVEEVIPSIRRFGFYMSEEKARQFSESPEDFGLIIRKYRGWLNQFRELTDSLKKLCEEQKRVNEALLVERNGLNNALKTANYKISEQSRQLQLARPAIAFEENYKKNNTAQPADFFAEEFGLSARKFNQVLVSFGILCEYVTKDKNTHRRAVGFWKLYAKKLVRDIHVPCGPGGKMQRRVLVNPASPGWLPDFLGATQAFFGKYGLLDCNLKFCINVWDNALRSESKRYASLGLNMPQAWAKLYFGQFVDRRAVGSVPKKSRGSASECQQSLF